MPLDVEHYEARSILTPTGGFLKPSAPDAADGYTHTLNPAIGCPYGRGLCGQFCYARVGMAQRFDNAGEWGESLRIKQNAAALLRAELARAAARPPDHRLHVSRLRIFASSSTDPCAGPALAPFRECLRVLAEYPIRRIVIQTRAPQIVRLRQEIEALGRRAAISFTIETDDEELWRAGPPGSPPIRARRAAFEALRPWRTTLHLAVSPCLPIRNLPAFADWAAAQADFVTVDTFTAGDGSGGTRTASLPLPAFLAARGHDWRDESQARALYRALRTRMGQRAGWSCDGFRRLAAE